MSKVEEMTVSQIMTQQLVTVSPDTTLDKVKALFDSHAFHHLLVVKGEILMGILSKIDVYRVTHCIDLFQSKANEEYNQKLLQSLLAEEVMTKNTTVLSPDDSVKYAAAIFSRNEFHALPVVKGEKLVGILTTFDLIKKAMS